VKVLAVIPARWGSSRFPGKPLAPILGKPMAQWVVEAALAAKLIDKVIVGTDDERIGRAAYRAGATVWFSKQEFKSGTDRCAAVARTEESDIVVNIQGDEPLIDPADLDSLVGFMSGPESAGYDIASLFYRGRPDQASDPNVVKLAIDPDELRDRLGLRHEAIWFSRAPVEPISKTLVHVGVYAFRRDFLLRAVMLRPTLSEKLERLEQLRWLGRGAKMMMLMAKGPTAAVDVPEDVVRVEAVLLAQNRPQTVPMAHFPENR